VPLRGNDGGGHWRCPEGKIFKIHFPACFSCENIGLGLKNQIYWQHLLQWKKKSLTKLELGLL